MKQFTLHRQIGTKNQQHFVFAENKKNADVLVTLFLLEYGGTGKILAGSRGIENPHQKEPGVMLGN